MHWDSKQSEPLQFRFSLLTASPQFVVLVVLLVALTSLSQVKDLQIGQVKLSILQQASMEGDIQ